MNSEREIVKRLLESKDIDESEFTYDGSKYVSRYGNYSKDGKTITKDDYHKAMTLFLNTKDDKGTMNYDLNLPYKVSSSKVKDFYDVIDDIQYDEEYEVGRPTRDHLPKINKRDTKTRVISIMKDANMTKDEAFKVNSIISHYTSTNPQKLTDEDKILLDKYLDNAPVYDADLLFRGMGFDISDGNDKEVYKKLYNLNVRDRFDFIGYTSFSSNPDVAIGFSESNIKNAMKPRQIYLINIKNLSGVSVEHLASSKYKEDELLYKPDTNMIIKDKIIKNGILYYVVEEHLLNEYDSNDELITIPIYGYMYKR